MKLFQKISGLFTSINNGYSDGVISLLSAGVFVQTKSMMNESFGVAVFIVNWGMAFIVGYGVIRITFNLIWNILFGKDFQWKIGILERLFRKLKPIKAQEIAERSDTETDEKTKHYLNKVVKARNRKRGGMIKMGFKKFVQKVNANKWTIMGVGSVVGLGVLTATGVLDPVAAKELVTGVAGANSATIQNGILTIAAATVTTAIGVRGVVGKGPENVEEYQERKSEEKEAKMARKKAKLDGTLDAERTKAKLMKKFNINEAKAEELVKDQLEAAKKEAELKEKEKQAKQVAKIAKKLGVSEEKAKELLK